MTGLNFPLITNNTYVYNSFMTIILIIIDYQILIGSSTLFLWSHTAEHPCSHMTLKSLLCTILVQNNHNL